MHNYIENNNDDKRCNTKTLTFPDMAFSDV